MLLAAVAAERGSESARDFILATEKSTGYSITLSRLSALRYLVNSSKPPAWIIDAIRQALSDTRQVSSTSFGKVVVIVDVSSLAAKHEHLIAALAAAKDPKSVPMLIEMAHREDDNGEALRALSLIGDPRAIPVFLELLQREDQMNKKEPQYHSAPSDELLRSLGKLKAKEAVPILLTYLHSDRVITALGEIGDERAIALLREVVAANGRVEPDPYKNEEIFQKERSFAAKMALIKIEGADPIPQWIAVMQDQSLEWAQRREAVWELGNHPDPRAIPPLLDAIKNDSDGHIVNQAVTVLTVFPYKAAVAGLIDRLDADFAGKKDWKRAYSPEMFADNIAATLHTLTGQNFGPDKAQWTKWWTEEGVNSEGLK